MIPASLPALTAVAADYAAVCAEPAEHQTRNLTREDNSHMEHVLLRTGDEMPLPLTAAITSTMKDLIKRNPIAFHELARLARDRTHQPFGTTAQTLTDCGLMDDGTLPESTRAIVIAATDIVGTDTLFVEPVIPRPTINLTTEIDPHDR